MKVMINNPIEKSPAGSNNENGFFGWVKRLITGEKLQAKGYEADDLELLEGIKKARKEWINASMNFEMADEEGIIDYYIYSIKAYEVKYQHLLKKAKEKGIKVSIANLSDSVYGVNQEIPGTQLRD